MATYKDVLGYLLEGSQLPATSEPESKEKGSAESGSSVSASTSTTESIELDEAGGRYYVGHMKGDAANTEVFTSAQTPTEQTHGAKYGAVTGPFRTKRGAEFMHKHGHNNPHCLSVADAERIAASSDGGEYPPRKIEGRVREEHAGPAEKGYEAYLVGKKLSDNPLKGNDATEWENGWRESRKDNGTLEGRLPKDLNKDTIEDKRLVMLEKGVQIEDGKLLENQVEDIAHSLEEKFPVLTSADNDGMITVQFTKEMSEWQQEDMAAEIASAIGKVTKAQVDWTSQHISFDDRWDVSVVVNLEYTFTWKGKGSAVQSLATTQSVPEKRVQEAEGSADFQTGWLDSEAGQEPKKRDNPWYMMGHQAQQKKTLGAGSAGKGTIGSQDRTKRGRAEAAGHESYEPDKFYAQFKAKRAAGRTTEGRLPSDMEKDTIEDKRIAMLEAKWLKKLADGRLPKDLTKDSLESKMKAMLEADEYVHDSRGIITDPGKFEGEMYYVPYFWAESLEGGADWEADGIWGVQITDEDRARFPELKAEDAWLFMEESEQGFVRGSLMNAERAKVTMDKCDREDAEGDEEGFVESRLMKEGPDSAVIEPAADLQVGQPIELAIEGGGGRGVIKGFGQHSRDHVLVDFANDGQHWVFSKHIRPQGAAAGEGATVEARSAGSKKDSDKITRLMKKSLRQVGKDYRSELNGKSVLVSSSRSVSEAGHKLEGGVPFVEPRSAGDRSVYEAGPDDLILLVDNEHDLYDMKIGAFENLARKKNKGVFDPQLAIRIFIHVVDAAAKRWYDGMVQWADDGKSIVIRPSMEVKGLAAKELVQDFMTWFEEEGKGTEQGKR